MDIACVWNIQYRIKNIIQRRVFIWDVVSLIAAAAAAVVDIMMIIETGVIAFVVVAIIHRGVLELDHAHDLDLMIDEEATQEIRKIF